MIRSLAFLACLAISSFAFAQTTRVAAEGATVIRTLLVHPPTSRAGGTVVAADPMQQALAEGTFTAPIEGQNDWSKLESDDKNHFEGQSLVGGWAWAEVESDKEQVMLLRAAGHVMVYFNGEPRAGDVYSAGYLALPVKLKAGKNTLFFQCGRGELSARLEPVTGPVMVLTEDATLPDLVEGQFGWYLAGVVAINTTNQPIEPRISTRVKGDISGLKEGSIFLSGSRNTLPPMSVRKVILLVPDLGGKATTESKITREVLNEGKILAELTVDVRKPQEMRKVTFLSKIDGSLQYFALRPAISAELANTPVKSTPSTQPTTFSKVVAGTVAGVEAVTQQLLPAYGTQSSSLAAPGQPGIVLSLHGASVEATNQANAYASKPDLHIVAATNRRPFGFDWEEWGRLDALEALAYAKQILPHDPSRTYLTGHSMGGHGTWHLGVNHPGMFAAIAPSAGWVSFASYSPGRAATRATTLPVLDAFRRASLASDTLALKENLAATGIQIIHGDVDDNVPVTQARTMVENLKAFHTDWRIHEQPGAGHWWDDNEVEPGATCVDHPEIFDLFARRRLPSSDDLRSVRFTTANPAIHSTVAWAEILQQITSGEYSSVDLKVDPHRRHFSGTTTNVNALALNTSALLGSGKVTLSLDGFDLAVESPKATLFLWKTEQGWRVGPAVPAGEKNPRRAGPLKNALGNLMIFVYGTKGTPEETALNYQKARYDAEMWHYRANGAVEVLPDTDPLLAEGKDRTLVLYGNADTNAAFDFLESGCPFDARRGKITLGNTTYDGDHTAIFCYPRKGSSIAMIVALAPTTPLAAKAHQRLPIFTSGIGWPDYTIISADSLKTGPKAIQSAGFFDQGWEQSR